MKGAVCFSQLPNFASTEINNICFGECDKFLVPPNSCCASQVSSRCEKTTSLQRDAEFTRFMDSRKSISYPLKTKLKIPTMICVPATCQIPKEQLKFMTRKIPDPLWNSLYCLERIKLLITSPALDSMGERIEEIWELYLRKSPNGIYLRDIHELSKIIRYLDLKFSDLTYAERFLVAIFNHMRKGILIEKSSENGSADPTLRVTFDSFGRLLVLGHTKIQLAILQTLLHWLDQFTQTQISCQHKYYPKSDEQHKSKCVTKKWKVDSHHDQCLNGKQGCGQCGDQKCDDEMCHQLETETKTIANCQMTFLRKPKPQEMLLSHKAFFGSVESSILPSVLEQIIKGDTYSDAYIQTLLIYRRFAENSYCIRSCVVNSQIVDACLLKLDYADNDSRILPRTLELMYAFLASGEDMNGTKICVVPGEESFEMLLCRFMSLMICDGNMPRPLTLRNDTIFLIYLFAYNVPELRSRFSQYLRDFASILSNNVLTESKFEVVLDSTNEDLELLMYIIWILDIVIPSKEEYHQIIQSFQLIPALMRLLLGPCLLTEEPGVGTTVVNNVMQSAARALETFARIKPLAFMKKEGIDIMLNTLGLFANNGNVTLDTVDSFLNIIRTILTSDLLLSDHNSYDELLFYFSNQNAIGVFSGVLTRLVNVDNFPVSLETTLCKLLVCCSEMGKYDEKQKDEFANKKGVKAILQLIHQLLYSKEQEEQHTEPLLHIMLADCIWNCIADCPSALEIFLLYEGMFRLLDLLEIATSPPSQVHITGVLLELCNYSRCADQMLFWRRQTKNISARFFETNKFNVSPTTRGTDHGHQILGDGMGEVVEDSDQSLAALFCELWREEEMRLNVLRDSNGVISSIEYPLLSEFARNYHRKIIPHRPLPPSSPGAACLDLIGTLRPRIYLLVKIMTEETNTEATVFGGLSVMNQVTMQIIINFLDLKRGEIWLEMTNEIEEEGLVCVASDKTAIECLLKVFRNKVAAVIDTQKYLLERATEQAAMNERELYNVIRNCQLQDYLMALREVQYYATTSEYFLLIDKKLWDKSEIDDYFRVPVEKQIGSTSIRSKSLKNILEGKHTSSPKTLDGILDGFLWSIDTDENDVTDIPYTPRNCKERLPSQLRSPDESLMSVEDGFYQIAPTALFHALTKLIAQQKLWQEKNVMNDETEWLMRQKWKMSWYPKHLEHI